MKRFGKLERAALAALLACSLAPAVPAAWADEGAHDATQPALEPGTYVEHEAIAYVSDDGVRARSAGASALDGAQVLMEVDAAAPVEALGDEAAPATGRSRRGGRSAGAGTRRVQDY